MDYELAIRYLLHGRIVDREGLLPATFPGVDLPGFAAAWRAAANLVNDNDCEVAIDAIEQNIRGGRPPLEMPPK